MQKDYICVQYKCQIIAPQDVVFSFKITLTNSDGTLVNGGNYYWYTEPAA